jgi:hypothetical protein
LGARRKSRWRRPAARPPKGIECRGSSFPTGETFATTEQEMDQRVVVSPDEARAAIKPRVVRYVLGISLLLVVILSVVIYSFGV